MNKACTIELHARGQWHAVAQVYLHGLQKRGL
jgi:hypothetical protein